MSAKDDADAAYRAELLDDLTVAAGRLGVRVAGDPVFGWRDRTVGAPVATGEGRRWLRLVREMVEWTDNEFWTGNADAAVLPAAVRRPSVVRVEEWDDGPRRFRAELMTLVDAVRCSPTPELRTVPSVDARWWASLRASLEALARTPTSRTAMTGEGVSRNLLVFFGIDVDPSLIEWSAAHGDLQWTNLTTPECWLLDWETWGQAPAGLDAATLYCHSLLVPDVESTVHETFADLLDTPAGQIAQLVAASRVLRGVDGGDYPDLAVPLHRHARRIIAGIDIGVLR